MKKQVYFVTIVIVLALVIGLWRENHTSANTSTTMISNLSPFITGTRLPEPLPLPSFHFTDMNNQPFSSEHLKKHWSFIFFGYSACSGICPNTLAQLKQIAHRLRNLPGFQVVFISLDFKSDTPERLKEYFSQDQYRYSPFLGVQGQEPEVKALAHIMGAYFHPTTNPEDPIEHSGTIYLIDPHGRLAAIFTSSQQPGAISQDVKLLVNQYTRGVTAKHS